MNNLNVLTICILLFSFNTVLASKGQNNFALPIINIGVDLNRDGKITFDNTQHTISVLQSQSETDVNKLVPSDKTYFEDVNGDVSGVLPFRFWLNNDLDVVNDGGNIKDVVSCDKLNGVNGYTKEYQQTCEQWDEAPVGMTNTSAGKLDKIENYRDLEDFSPLKIQLNAVMANDDYIYELHANGIGVNLFKGVWGDDPNLKSHAYIYETGITKNQVEIANAAGNILLKANTVVQLKKGDLDRFFKSDGSGYFIFEGLESCKSLPKDCYLAIIYRKKDNVKPLVEKRVYLDLHDVGDFYEHIDAGPSAELAGTTYTEDDAFGDIVIKQSGFHAKYDGPDWSTRAASIDIYKSLFSPADIEKDYVLQIHGWRMLDSEKLSFSDTTFKRLYWSGYKGKMGALHWPTGWFEKAAHAYGVFVLSYVLGNERNYDISETVARRVGVDLAARLVVNPKQSTHIIAHSMGNVIASEALLNGGVVTSYAASQAATAAGSYDSAAADMQHTLLFPGVVSCLFSVNSILPPETAWRCYNFDSNPDTSFDMPPDMYRNDFIAYEVDPVTGERIIDVDTGKFIPIKDQKGNYIIKHGPTSSTIMGANSDARHHFKGISTNVNIINLYNSEDLALTAWEFNQLTKPDFSQGKSWSYSNTYLEALKIYNNCDPVENCTEPTLPTEVTSIFKHNGIPVPYNPDTANDILAYAVPARTEPLGQAPTLGEISGGENNLQMTGFTDSNQDHSGPYHGYYSEVSPNPNVNTKQRAVYWNLVLNRSLRLDADLDYTGLKNTIQ